MGVILDEIKSVVGKSVKADNELMTHIFIAGISAFTNNPINLAIIGPAGSGKTYTVRNTLQYFPKEYVITLASASPTALIHRKPDGYVDKDGKEITDEIEAMQQEIAEAQDDNPAVKKLKKELSVLLENAKPLVKLENKILVFFESPQIEFYDRIKPILSHDARDIEYWFTDRRGKKGLQTETIILRGWPAVIFCAADDQRTIERYDQMRSRFIIVSPNLSEKKMEEARQYQATLAATPSYDHERIIGSDDERSKVKGLVLSAIETIRPCYVQGESHEIVINPFALDIAKNFPKPFGEDMRLFNQFMTYVKNHTLLHVNERPYFIRDTAERFLVQKYYFTTLEDVENSYRLLRRYLLTRTSAGNIEFFENVFLPAFRERNKSGNGQQALGSFDVNFGISSEELHRYNLEHGIMKLRTTRRVQQYLQTLEEVGIITSIINLDDRRKKLYFPIQDLSFSMSACLLENVDKNNLIEQLKTMEQQTGTPIKYYQPGNAEINVDTLVELLVNRGG